MIDVLFMLFEGIIRLGSSISRLLWLKAHNLEDVDYEISKVGLLFSNSTLFAWNIHCTYLPCTNLTYINFHKLS